ncbi:unnamed protein product [Heterosigma akashiwo]
MGEQSTEKPSAPGLRRNLSASDLSEYETTDPRKYQIRKSKLIGLINWTHVLSTYYPYFFLTVVAAVTVQFGISLYENRNNVEELTHSLAPSTSDAVFDLAWKFTLLAALLLIYLARRGQNVYLVDFACFEPPEDWKVNHEELVQIMRAQRCFSDDSLKFMERILARSATGQATAWPPGIIRSLKDPSKVADRSVEAARAESETVIFGAVEEVLRKTKCDPKKIDFLVINCSLFSPTPSLCSMVVHKFGLRASCLTYNLSGMGCSAGVISIDLAKRLMASKRNATCLVVSTENLTQNLYHGNEKNMLLQNTLFRVGGAAMLLSNGRLAGWRAKFKLLCTVRTQGMGEDAA